MRRKKQTDGPKIIQNDLVMQMGGPPPPSNKRKNPPKDDPYVQARLDRFVADDRWISLYKDYRAHILTKKQAALNVGVGNIEFSEQIKLYETSLRLQKYAPEMQARLKAFIADDDWLHLYFLCADEVISTNEAAERLGIEKIEFTEQIRLYEEKLKRKGLWVDELAGVKKADRDRVIDLMCKHLDIIDNADEAREFEIKYLQPLYKTFSDSVISVLKDESVKKWRKTRG